MSSQSVMRRFSSAIAATVMFTACAVSAQEGPRPEVEISAGLEASSNPFLLENGSEALAAFISVDPSVFLEEGRNTTVLDGTLRATQYLNDYGTDASGRLRLSTQRALTERTRLELTAAVMSSRRSFQEGVAGGPESAPLSEPGALPVPVTLDPTLIGALVRSTSLSATGSLEHELSPVSSLSTGASYSRTTFSNNAGFDVNSAAASLAYGRIVAPQTTIKLGGQIALFDFAGRDVGDAYVYSVQARIEHEIGTRWRAALGGGVDLVDRDLGIAGRETSSLFSGDIGLCNTGLRARFCVTARRAAQPTAIGGVSTVVSVAMNYDLELSRNGTLTITSQFGRSDQSFDNGFATAGTTVDVYGATARYQHALSERLSFFVLGGYSDVSDDLRDVPSNAFVRIGVTLGFGRRS